MIPYEFEGVTLFTPESIPLDEGRAIDLHPENIAAWEKAVEELGEEGS